MGEAIANGADALQATIAALKVNKHPVPKPGSGGVASGKFIARVPKTVHAQLIMRAKPEGVSLNALVLTFIAQGLEASRGMFHCECCSATLDLNAPLKTGRYVQVCCRENVITKDLPRW